MSQPQGFPSKDPSLEGGGMAGMLKQVLGKFLQNVDNALPAKVTGYDRKANTATVQPVVAVLSTEGQSLPRAKVASVPVLALGGGGFIINFPLKPGDLGWLHASDRDISLFMQGLQEARPNTVRMHSFEDGLFIPDVIRKFVVSDEDMDANMVIQSLDGKIRLALWPDRVKATADKTSFEVNSDGTITGTAPQKVFFDTPLVEYAGVFKSGVGQGGGGESIINGRLRATEDMIADDVSLKDHPHQGVQSGEGTTGPPVGGA
jgi:hypothetical protein